MITVALVAQLPEDTPTDLVELAPLVHDALVTAFGPGVELPALTVGVGDAVKAGIRVLEAFWRPDKETPNLAESETRGTAIEPGRDAQAIALDHVVTLRDRFRIDRREQLVQELTELVIERHPQMPDLPIRERAGCKYQLMALMLPHNSDWLRKPRGPVDPTVWPAQDQIIVWVPLFELIAKSDEGVVPSHVEFDVIPAWMQRALVEQQIRDRLATLDV